MLQEETVKELELLFSTLGIKSYELIKDGWWLLNYNDLTSINVIFGTSVSGFNKTYTLRGSIEAKDGKLLTIEPKKYSFMENSLLLDSIKRLYSNLSDTHEIFINNKISYERALL